MPHPPEGPPPAVPFTDEQTEGHAPLSGNGHRPVLRKKGMASRTGSTYLRRRVVVGVLLVLIVLMADAAYAFLRSGELLSDARDSFESAATALADSDLMEAKEHLDRGLERADGAADLTSHPGFTLMRATPLGDDARALDAIIEAIRLSARAGLIAIEGGEAMAPEGEGIAPAILRDGRVQFDLLERGRPYLERAARILNGAEKQFDTELHPRLGAVGRALASANLRVAGAGESVDRLVALFGSLPSLLAEEGTRRYLLAFQAPGEARGTGGVIGLLGVLKAEDGRLSLGDIRPYSELQPRPIDAVKAPEWFEKRYAPFFGLRQWPQVNLSPHFPTVSKILLRMYGKATGRSLDGVMAMDPVALESMMEAVEPIHQRGFDASLTQNNIAEVMMKDAYTFPTPDAQNAFLEGVVRKFWDAVAEGAFDSLSMVEGLGGAVATQHLKVYSDDIQDGRSLAFLRADGDFTQTGPNLQMVWHNNVAVNKVDYFLERDVSTSISLGHDGSAEIRTEIQLVNNAPAGPPSLLLGPGIKGDPPGMNRMYLNVLLPKGADVTRFSIDGTRRKPFRDTEAGFPLVWDVLQIPAGERSLVQVDYEVADLVSSSPSEDVLEFTLLPQAMPHPDKYELELELPEEMEGTVEVEEGLLVSESTVISTGDLGSPRQLRVVVEP